MWLCPAFVVDLGDDAVFVCPMGAFTRDLLAAPGFGVAGFSSSEKNLSLGLTAGCVKIEGLDLWRCWL